MTLLLKIVERYLSVSPSSKERPERCKHDGISTDDERKAEIEASGLFKLLEKIEYTQEMRNNPRQYLLAMKSVPAYAAVLDGLGQKVIEEMDREITNVINENGGFTQGQFLYSLYLCRKVY